MRVELGSEGEGAKSVRRGKELYKYFAPGGNGDLGIWLVPMQAPSS